MSIKFSERSLSAMNGIHPKLREVLDHAATIASASEDFMVLEGVRSREAMMVNYGKGRVASELTKFGIPAHYAQPSVAKVTWLADPFNSNHKLMPDGYGHAVDLAPWPVDFKDIKRYVTLYTLIMGSAREVGVKLRSGMDWDGDGHLMERGETDLGHYEIIL